jgi:hypothetical protein
MPSMPEHAAAATKYAVVAVGGAVVITLPIAEVF